MSCFPLSMELGRPQHAVSVAGEERFLMNRKLKWLLFAFFLSALCSSEVKANTYTAATCSESDVASAVGKATNGDTVVIPACSAIWTTELVVNVGITLQGQGIGSTVLIDNVPKGNSNCGSAYPMISFTVNSPNVFHITGFTLQGSAPDTYICQPGHMSLSGTSTAIQVDHISFLNQQTVGIRTHGSLLGVIDNCAFQGNHKQGIIVQMDTWGGDSYGDGSWAAPTQLGTANFLFIETNTFTDPSAVGAGAFDVFGGGRVVFRHNTASFIVGHGTESAQRMRGMRAFEIYDNTFTAIEPSQFAGFYVRSGTGVIHDNQFIDNGSNYYNGIINAINDRDNSAFPPWGAPGGSGNPGACDGTGPWDTNTGTVYASGTASSSSSANNLVANGSGAWATNQWVGNYAIRNVTQGWGALIRSNSGNSITNVGSAYAQNRNWNSGDTFQVMSAHPCIDQVGRGQGALLSGSIPTPTGSVNEGLEPVYQWNNTHNGSSNVTISSQSSRIVANREYYDNTQMPGYTPYPYPHPLTQGSGTPPAPPTNLTATVQ